ncbi:OLC1v1012889C1 [Oldenlandia corymbosa var. corymbosa]|uniref:OLC1v1012889C1 n=1 Tax=Oldenlandia corymbosa var. corymbosa TaxID=529605 RepID=A0AAV1E078_OLDCO|nr:OLC1v1012889C1 [Oldenlandia corymbosa var. corymbosa]
MVAISLYRGNLHKVPDVPRKWLMPAHQLTIKDFKNLLGRRTRALSLLPNPQPVPGPNPRIGANSPKNDDDNGIENPIADVATSAEPGISQLEEPQKNNDKGEENVGKLPSEGGNCVQMMEVDVSASAVVELNRNDDLQNVATENELNVAKEGKEEEERKGEKSPEVATKPNSETINKDAAESSDAKRKKEVEERLKFLKEQKHGLVQVLKQIQNAEDELKRRTSTQGGTGRPVIPLKVDIPNDSGSITRVNTPRMGSDGTSGAEIEGGEPNSLANLTIDTRQLLRVSSTSPSPSSDSQHKKPAFGVVSS